MVPNDEFNVRSNVPDIKRAIYSPIPQQTGKRHSLFNYRYRIEEDENEER
jgi:hypothetical protein